MPRFFEFGNSLRLLRPSLDVRCVEDCVLREMKPIAQRYEPCELGAAPLLVRANVMDVSVGRMEAEIPLAKHSGKLFCAD
jgi:hypothetical protein